MEFIAFICEITLLLVVVGLVTTENHLPVYDNKPSGQLIIETAKQAMHKAGKQQTTRHHGGHHGPLSEIRRGAKIVGFDIILTPEQARERIRDNSSNRYKRKAIRSSVYHWPGGVIPYSFSVGAINVNPMAKQIVQAAMLHWEQHTCIRFVEKEDALPLDDILVIKRGEWCSSNLGHIGGEQYLYIHPDCLTLGSIVHELGHTIGWVHEHARPDRDQYVRIDWSRILPDYRDQYLKERFAFVYDYGVPYDYDSIMHYPDNDGELKTLNDTDQHRIGQRERLSFNDRKLANRMYRCAAKCPSNIECEHPGYIDQKCKCVCPGGMCEKEPTLSHSSPTPLVPLEENNNDTNSTDEIDDDECAWRYYRGKALNVDHQKRYIVTSLDHCKLKCLEERDIVCRSFHFSPYLSVCFLSNSWEKKRDFTFSGFIYFERPNCLIIGSCGWTKVEASYVSMDDNTSKINYDVSLAQCMLACLEEMDFKCSSIMFRVFRVGSSICVHTTASRATHAINEDDRITYYERRPCE